jgi:hypothetical protein
LEASYGAAPPTFIITLLEGGAVVGSKRRAASTEQNGTNDQPAEEQPGRGAERSDRNGETSPEVVSGAGAALCGNTMSLVLLQCASLP